MHGEGRGRSVGGWRRGPPGRRRLPAQPHGPGPGAWARVPVARPSTQPGLASLTKGQGEPSRIWSPPPEFPAMRGTGLTQSWCSMCSGVPKRKKSSIGEGFRGTHFGKSEVFHRGEVFQGEVSQGALGLGPPHWVSIGIESRAGRHAHSAANRCWGG